MEEQEIIDSLVQAPELLSKTLSPILATYRSTDMSVAFKVYSAKMEGINPHNVTEVLESYTSLITYMYVNMAHYVELQNFELCDQIKDYIDFETRYYAMYLKFHNPDIDYPEKELQDINTLIRISWL